MSNDKMSAHFTEKQLTEFKEAFAMFDKQGEGKMLIKDIGMILRSLGYNPTEKYIQEVIKENLPEEKINLSQFIKIMETRAPVNCTEEELRTAFNIFDKNQNGFITADELRHVMVNLGEKLTEDEAQAMIQEADTDGDGKINFQDFITVMLNN